MSRDLDDGLEDESLPDRFQKARSAVGLPATLLIVLGALGLLNALLGLMQRDKLPAQLDQMIANIEADPNMPREDKDNAKEMVAFVKDAIEHPAAMITYVVNIIMALLVLIGGIRMMQMSGPALPTIGAVLVMIPCSVGCCCLIGVPVGIYALMVLSRPEVRIAMAAKHALPQNPDDSEPN